MLVKKVYEQLTRQEEEAMIIIWKSGKGFVKDILENMPVPRPHYNTLASTIKNLEKKGFVTSSKLGNMYQYLPAISEDSYKKHFFTGFVKNYFNNSYKNLMTFFADHNKISEIELREIMKIINKKR